MSTPLSRSHTQIRRNYRSIPHVRTQISYYYYYPCHCLRQRQMRHLCSEEKTFSSAVTFTARLFYLSKRHTSPATGGTSACSNISTSKKWTARPRTTPVQRHSDIRARLLPGIVLRPRAPGAWHRRPAVPFARPQASITCAHVAWCAKPRCARSSARVDGGGGKRWCAAGDARTARRGRAPRLG